jgi:hypothetical protein
VTEDQIQQILKRIPEMPRTAFVPPIVAARHDNVSERTVRRRYQVEKLSPGRSGVRVGFLRRDEEQPT